MVVGVGGEGVAIVESGADISEVVGLGGRSRGAEGSDGICWDISKAARPRLLEEDEVDAVLFSIVKLLGRSRRIYKVSSKGRRAVYRTDIRDMGDYGKKI